MSINLIDFVFLLIITEIYSIDSNICQSINCGPGRCKTTDNPTLPYYCQCPDGSNTILPCPSENPCSRNPCGHGICEVVPKLLYGYMCRCAGDTISLTSCNQTQNSCATKPCLNGICIEGLTSFICDCLPSWTGRLCNEKIGSSCSNNLCGPGKCFSIENPTLPYICLCPNSEFHVSCPEKSTSSTTVRMLVETTRSIAECNPLDSQSCAHGGQCLPMMNGYQCLCKAEYTGRFCETKINECESNPCLYGGVCYDLQSSYICACPDGTFRTQCLPIIGRDLFSMDDLEQFQIPEIITTTTRSLTCPCQNGGICSVMGPELCSCLMGFTGQFCENTLMTMNQCQQIQCLNGGTCDENSLMCQCKNGFAGKLCEIEYFRCQFNGRFMDQYNCEKGKYFECIHYGQDVTDSNGVLLSRTCPPTLRFNVLIDGCDYPKNVQCLQK